MQLRSREQKRRKGKERNEKRRTVKEEKPREIVKGRYTSMKWNCSGKWRPEEQNREKQKQKRIKNTERNKGGEERPTSPSSFPSCEVPFLLPSSFNQSYRSQAVLTRFQSEWRRNRRMKKAKFLHIFFFLLGEILASTSSVPREVLTLFQPEWERRRRESSASSFVIIIILTLVILSACLCEEGWHCFFAR